MSTSEQLFFDPGDSNVEAAGGRMAAALALTLGWDHHDVHLWTTSDPELPVAVGGLVTANIFAEAAPEKPEDSSIFDPFPMVFELRVPKSQLIHQEAVALILFRRAADRLAWPSVLTHEYADLVATYDSERGLRTFPPGTLSDAAHEHLWR